MSNTPRSTLRMPFKTPEQIRRDQDARRSNGRPFKPKAWSHQDELKALIGKPLKLQLTISTGVTMVGGILEKADAYTLQISDPNDRQSTMTYFKSALVGYLPCKLEDLG